MRELESLRVKKKRIVLFRKRRVVKLYLDVYETWLHMSRKASITFHWSFRNKLKGFEGL